MNLRRGIALFRGQRDFHFDIVGKRRIWFALSGAVILISLAGLVFRGLNLGIDFEGGALLDYPNEAGRSVEEISRQLGVPSGTVKARLARGRTALARRLGTDFYPVHRETLVDE